MAKDSTSPKVFRELAYRADDGLELALLWSELENRLAVSVSDARSGELFALDAENDDALDVFYHPFTQAALAGSCVATKELR